MRDVCRAHWDGKGWDGEAVGIAPKSVEATLRLLETLQLIYNNNTHVPFTH